MQGLPHSQVAKLLSTARHMGFGLFHAVEHLQSEKEGWGEVQRERERDGDRLTEQDLEGDRRWGEGLEARSDTWRERGRRTPGRETGSENTQQ